MKKKILAAGLVALMATVSATAVNAATVIKSVAIKNGATIVGTGTFSYDDSKTGVIGYNDLSSFSFTGGGNTYDLAFVNALDPGAYKYFGYDITANDFVSGAIAGNYGTYSGIFAAATGALNNGFFFDPLPGQADPAGSGADGIYAFYNVSQDGHPFTSVAIAAVPEPATWAMMLAGFGLMGFGLRNRVKPTVRVAYA